MTVEAVAAVEQIAWRLDGGDLVGFAAPDNGRQPAGLVLRAGEILVRAVRAARFDADAADAGIRYGWCGFRLAHVAEGLAVARELVLSCEASGRVLARLTSDGFAPRDYAAPRRVVSVHEMLSQVRAHDTATEVGQIVPIAERALDVMSDPDFADAAFRTILDRRRDRDAEGWAVEAVKGRNIAGFLGQLAESDEFRRRSLPFLPGPFHPNWMFSLAFL